MNSWKEHIIEPIPKRVESQIRWFETVGWHNLLKWVYNMIEVFNRLSRLNPTRLSYLKFLKNVLHVTPSAGLQKPPGHRGGENCLKPPVYIREEPFKRNFSGIFQYSILKGEVNPAIRIFLVIQVISCENYVCFYINVLKIKLRDLTQFDRHGLYRWFNHVWRYDLTLIDRDVKKKL